MLLKHNRKQPAFKDGGNSSSIQRTAMQVRQSQVFGTYITKGERIEKKNEIQRAHFHMGFDKNQMPKQSYGQELIDASAGHINEQTIHKAAKDMADRKEGARRSNFNVGHVAAKSNKDKYAVDTASRAAFKPEFLANHGGPARAKKDFQSGKLYMGSSGTEYTTTNNDNFSDQLLHERLRGLDGGDSVAEQQQRVMKNKMQQFTYGHDQPTYQSIAKRDFPQHGTDSMANNISKISSLKVGETHFHLGTDKFIDQTGQGTQPGQWSPGKGPGGKHDSQNNSGKKATVGMPYDPKQLNQKTNFKLGQKNLVPNQFCSMQKQAMESVKSKGKSGLGQYDGNKTPEPTLDMKAEVQKTHFNLGTSKLDYVSYAGGTMIEHPITKEEVHNNLKNRKMAIEQMRNANFKLPTQQVLKTGASTYKEKMSDITAENALAGQSAQLLTNLKHSSVQVGRKGSKLECATEQADQFVNKQNDAARASDLKDNKNMKTYLKGHHFELGALNAKGLSVSVQGPHSVLTAPVTGSNHYLNQYKQSSQETGKLQREQRAHHFQMGYELRPTTAATQFGLQKHLSQQIPASVSPQVINRATMQVSTAQVSNRVPAFEQRNRFSTKTESQSRSIQDMVNANRATNIVYGQGNANTGRGQTVKTINQAYFKWIQPVQ